MIHSSVIERLGQPIRGKLWDKNYVPRNLVPILDAVKETYGIAKTAEGRSSSVRIVDWDGRPLDPEVSADRLAASSFLSAAIKRLG
jgi:hypothetical protein